MSRSSVGFFHSVPYLSARGRHSPRGPLVEAAHPFTSHAGRACVLLGPTLQLSDPAPTHLHTRFSLEASANNLDYLLSLLVRHSLTHWSLWQWFSLLLSTSTPVISGHPGDFKGRHRGRVVVPAGSPFHTTTPVSSPPSYPRHVTPLHYNYSLGSDIAGTAQL